jgi:hypothetical protein
MKLTHILVSLVLAGILSSAVLAQEATPANTQKTETRAEMKAKHDKKINEGKATGQRVLKNRKKHSKFDAAQNPVKQKPKKAPKKGE